MNRCMVFREGLVHNPKFLLVAIEDIDSFDAELSEKVRKAPADFLPLVKFQKTPRQN